MNNDKPQPPESDATFMADVRHTGAFNPTTYHIDGVALTLAQRAKIGRACGYIAGDLTDSDEQELETIKEILDNERVPTHYVPSKPKEAMTVAKLQRIIPRFTKFLAELEGDDQTYTLQDVIQRFVTITSPQPAVALFVNRGDDEYCFEIDRRRVHIVIEGDGYKVGVGHDYPFIIEVEIDDQQYRLISGYTPERELCEIHQNTSAGWVDVQTMTIPSDHPVVAILRW